MSKFLDLDGLEYYTKTFVKPGLTEFVDTIVDKNLFYLDLATIYQNELNGLSAIQNADGSVTISGTMTDTTKQSVCYLSARKANLQEFIGYVISGGISADASLRIQNGNSPYNTIVYSNGDGAVIPNTLPSETVIYFRIAPTSSSVNYTFYPMICTLDNWNISHSYVPYRNGLATKEEIRDCFQNA